MRLHPIILAGGCGTRLWPMSRESFPKQFLPLLDGASPFQATLDRCAALGGIEPATIVVNAEHRFLAADQAKGAGRALKRIYVEPIGRSTAPAIALVAHELVADDPHALMLVLPADHDIPDESPFAQAVETAQAAAIADDAGCRRIDRATFERCRAMSIDHAVMERTQSAGVVPARFRWSDIGSWDALWDRAAKDEDGNEVHGDVQLHDAENCYVHSEQRLVVGIGLEDTVIIDTPDAILVARRGETQRVREAVEQLKTAGRSEHKTHRLVHRPWGHYEDIDAGERFRVKRITVAPGGKLSLQYHHHRAEHWIVVSGTARVTRGTEVSMVSENQSVYIPLGEMHRLENPGKIPLQLIEVQTGAYLGEDDIVRVEDIYARVDESNRGQTTISHMAEKGGLSPI